MQTRISKKRTIGRRAFAIVMLGLYLLFSVGIIKATHFCMGREASVQFFTAESKKCPCSVYSYEKDACCHDESELLKIHNDQKVISSVSVPIPVWKVERIFTERLLAVVDTGLTPVLSSAPAPPKIPLWKANRCYVFYDDAANIA